MNEEVLATVTVPYKNGFFTVEWLGVAKFTIQNELSEKSPFSLYRNSENQWAATHDAFAPKELNDKLEEAYQKLIASL